MMSVYAVMVQGSADRRWIDSLWVRRYSFQHGAEARQQELQTTFEALNITYKTWVVEMKIQDAEIEPVNPQRQQPSDPATEAGTQQKGEGR